MSADNYANRLKTYPNKGQLNLVAQQDPMTTVLNHAQLAAEWIRTAKKVVVHTGAGISTASGIRDFRSVDGVWSVEERLAKRHKSHRNDTLPSTTPISSEPSSPNVTFETAQPTFAHLALAHLMQQ